MENWKEKSKDELRSWLLEKLSGSILGLTFEKKDGTIREMKATLRSDLVKEYERKTERTRVANPEVISVFDTEISEWRSFRLDSLKEVNQ